MRSVNDYSMSSHELFTIETQRPFAKVTSVYRLTNVRPNSFHEIENKIREKMIEQYPELKQQKEYVVKFKDKIEITENDKGIYAQHFFILSGVVDVEIGIPQKKCVILEYYHRDNDFVAVFLATESVSWMDEFYIELQTEYKAEQQDVKNEFHTIGKSSYGFELQTMKLDLTFDERLIETNYNDSFTPVWGMITDSIDEDKNGLFLLHGTPGTGKTSIVKQVIARGGKRKIIYIPPYLAASLSDPSFISFVRENMTNSVLVIEDAEDVLLARDIAGGNSAVSNILNISNGILGDALNILIVATFNTDLERIDEALRRKGRCIAEYQFTPLTQAKGQALIEELHGPEMELKKGESFTLANIYNAKVVQPKTVKQERKVGF